jgi:Type II secretion system (T2SS), protein M subtype b
MTPSMWGAQLLQAARRLGMVGALGLALLGLAAWAQWVWLPRQQADLAQWASQARGLRHALLADSAAASGPSGASGQTGPSGRAQPDFTRPDQAWQIVWAGLPRSDRRMAMQAAVLQAARAQGLQLTQVQYQGQQEAWARQGGDILWRQRMTMPVQGSQPAVKAWLQALLREPALSVDALGIQRDNASSDAVAAQLSVSLWWRQPAGGQP